MIGEVLDGWRLVKKLGEGGTGETYLAEREATGEKAAVKVLFLQISSDRALLDRLFADAAAASKVNHVGMADLLGWGVHGSGRAFLVMEHLEGKTLTDALIELGSVTDLESFADIGWQLATLLGAAHAAGLVHGALKPDGIYLTFPPSQAPRPLVKVLDFGMARFSLNIRHSQTGSLLGAPLYMSPEVGRGLGSVDHRADIYSLGCILFEMLCGRPPFVREGKGELIIAHMTEAPPPVSSLEPSVPQALDNLVGRMLTKNPAVRPQSMGEVAAVLERFFKCPAPGAGQAVAPGPAKPAAAVPAPVFPTPQPAPPVAPIPRFVPPEPSRPTSPPVATPPRLEATAYLPPDARDTPSPQATPPAPQAWLARVHQRTAILEPSSPPGDSPARSVSVLLPAPEDQPRPSRAAAARTREAPRPAQAAPINLPVVIATASIVLAVGAGILVFRSRASAPGSAAPAPREEARRASPSEEGFRPPPPPPQPLPAVTPELAVVPVKPRAASAGTSVPRAPRTKPEPPARPTEPKKKPSRW